MAEERKGYRIKSGGLGEVHVSEEVIAIIAGLAATEVEGVCAISGNITADRISRLGTKNLAKGIRILVDGDKISVRVTIHIKYGYAIPKIAAAVQEKVKNAVESMTGMSVDQVIVRVAQVIIRNAPEKSADGENAKGTDKPSSKVAEKASSKAADGEAVKES